MNQAAALNEHTLLNFAMQAQQKGMLQHAEAAYRKILATNPEHADALQLLGVVASQAGHHSAGEELILKSLQVDPNNSNARFNLLKIYRDQSENRQMKKGYEEALKLFKKAENKTPDSIEVLRDISNLLEFMDCSDDAQSYYEKAYQIARDMKDPTLDAYIVLGAVSTIQGDFSAAIENNKKALTFKPDDSVLITNLAEAYKKSGNLYEAEKYYLKALEVNPHSWQVYCELGLFYWEHGQIDRALTAYEEALKLNPDSLHIMTCAGIAYTDKYDFINAQIMFDKVLERDPENSQVHFAMGNIQTSLGNIPEALRHFKLVYTVKKDSEAHSNYIFIMHYDPSATSKDIHQETLAWAQRYATNLPAMQHHNIPDPQRRLRIGYVSGDLRHHPVTPYLEPVLKSHDKSKFEIFCYANQAVNDDVTKRLMSYSDHWCSIYSLKDDVVADRIQKDKIDILIDLSGHTAKNRLLVFARKPAPIQATWIGYFNTTGLSTMDYIITDRFLLPPEDEHLYTEKPLRLPHSGAVYKPHDIDIEINQLPAINNGYITFGCFNAMSKLTPEVIKLWAEILKQVADAKLFLKNKAFDDESVCDEFRKTFAKLGVDPSRLIFAGFSPLRAYMQTYNHVDLGLDPFPYNGATTTLDSLSMGVPMIALKGDRLVSHIGESLLGNLGLEEFVASTKEEYVQKAVSFASDTQKLAEIRANLRQTMMTSPMTNPESFTRGLEDALRKAWMEWCGKQKA